MSNIDSECDMQFRIILSVQIVADSLSTHCKCHGVSGSCTVKTCYRALPVDLRPTIGAALKSRYAVAVHVDGQTANSPPGGGAIQPLPPPAPRGRSRPSPSPYETSSAGRRSKSSASSSSRSRKSDKQQQSTRNPTPESQQSDWPGATRAVPPRGGGRRSPIDRVDAMLANKSVRDEDLIYFTISPDYCLPDAALGSVGTKDRSVNTYNTLLLTYFVAFNVDISSLGWSLYFNERDFRDDLKCRFVSFFR